MLSNTTASHALNFERQLDEALLAYSVDPTPCTVYVRTLLDLLPQQPFLPAYAVHSLPELARISDQLLELPSSGQTQVLIKVFQAREPVCVRTATHFQAYGSGLAESRTFYSWYIQLPCGSHCSSSNCKGYCVCRF